MVSETHLKSFQVALKGFNALGQRVSISVRSETFSESPSAPRVWVTSWAGFCGQATLECDMEHEPEGGLETELIIRYPRSEPER